MRTLLKKLFFVSLIGNQTYGQSGTIATGNEASGTGGTMSYSIGQIDYKYQNGSNGTINQGLQQPFEFFTIGIDEYPEIILEMMIFPNPTLGELYLKINDVSENIKFQLFDETGKLILEKAIQDLNTLIDLKTVPRATYFLIIIKEELVLKTFKIVKN